MDAGINSILFTLPLLVLMLQVLIRFSRFSPLFDSASSRRPSVDFTALHNRFSLIHVFCLVIFPFLLLLLRAALWSSFSQHRGIVRSSRWESARVCLWVSLWTPTAAAAASRTEGKCFPSFESLIRPFIRPFIHPPFHPPIHSFIHSFESLIRSLIRSFLWVFGSFTQVSVIIHNDNR